MTSITSKQKHDLKVQASRLNPIVLIGNKGLTEPVHQEIERALHDHELVKIRFHIKDRAYQKQAAVTICQQHQAILIDAVGHVIVIYRPRQED